MSIKEIRELLVKAHKTTDRDYHDKTGNFSKDIEHCPACQIEEALSRLSQLDIEPSELTQNIRSRCISGITGKPTMYFPLPADEVEILCKILDLQTAEIAELKRKISLLLSYAQGVK